MPAGNLRHSLLLEKRAQAAEGTDSIAATFAPVSDAWGEVKQVRAGTYLDGQQVGETITHIIRLRYRSATDFGFISEGARRFRVKRIGDPDGRRRWLEVFAEELQPGDDA
jgi:head-tail adaptor